MDSFDQAVEQVLKQSKYNILSGRVMDIRKHISDWFTSLLHDLLSNVSINIPADRLSGDAITHIFLVTAVFFILLFLGALIALFMRKHRKTAGFTIDELMQDMEGSASHLDLVARSNHFAAMSQYRESIRCRFIALLMVLHENRMIAAYPAMTNNQIKNQLKGNRPGFALSYSEIADTCSQVWFGHRAVQQENFDRYCRETDQFMREVAHEKPV